MPISLKCCAINDYILKSVKYKCYEYRVLFSKGEHIPRIRDFSPKCFASALITFDGSVH